MILIFHTAFLLFLQEKNIERQFRDQIDELVQPSQNKSHLIHTLLSPGKQARTSFLLVPNYILLTLLKGSVITSLPKFYLRRSSDVPHGVRASPAGKDYDKPKSAEPGS